MAQSVEVAVIGGGISGLAAAYELLQQRTSFAVLESRPRAGGVIQTERAGDFVIDAGPDALLVQKPAALALCKEIGLADRLVPTKPPRTAYILRRGILHSLPEASVLGFPTRLRPMLQSALFSWRGKMRMGAEVLIPRRTSVGDESIAAFVGRRFGSEAVEYIAEPLLAGIHAGDVDRLSMKMLFPRLVEAETTSGSVIRSLRRQSGHRSPDGAFRSFPNGLAELIEGLLRVLPREAVQVSSAVTAIERTPAGHVIRMRDREPVEARAVLLAVPGFAAGQLVSPIDTGLAELCSSIRYLSTATVALGFPRDAVRHDLAGTGFVVPRSEGLHITAGAWISSKWPHRAPENQALLRAFLGGAREPDILQRNDDELAAMALKDLRPILSISGEPVLTRVFRWNRSSPQQEVGHADLMQSIDTSLASHPGLFISAAGFRGVGIPDCVADARDTAKRVTKFLQGSRP